MKSTVKLAIVSVLCLILFGTCTFFMRNLLFGGIAGTYEQAEPNRKEYNDKWITYEVVACLGCYAESTETYAFIPTGHEYFYIIWMEDGSIMPLSVSKKADRDYLDALTDATYDYIDGNTKMIEMEPRTFIGTVSSQDSEIAGYYRDALNSIEITEANGWVIRSVLLECTKTRTSYLILVGAVMMIPVLGITFTIVNVRKEKRKKENPEQDYLPR
ncbi:MAG: hypothetical protein IKG01_03965 [Lachnospiraceae bacterium]|nr:hypothetical protein [Lachnospiraceae bacterium]